MRGKAREPNQAGKRSASAPEGHAQGASVPAGLVGHGHDKLHHGQHEARQQEGEADPADDPAAEAEVLRVAGAPVEPCLLLNISAGRKHGPKHECGRWDAAGC